MRPFWMSGDLCLLPWRKTGIEICKTLGGFLFQLPDLVRNGHGLVLGRQGPEFGDLAFEFGNACFEIQVCRHYLRQSMRGAPLFSETGRPSPFCQQGEGHLALAQGMMGLDDFSQALRQHMRINLRRRNVRVAKHLLDGPEIRPAGQEMAGERMPQNMG
jgi:hypothetical protein